MAGPVKWKRENETKQKMKWEKRNDEWNSKLKKEKQVGHACVLVCERYMPNSSLFINLREQEKSYEKRKKYAETATESESQPAK